MGFIGGAKLVNKDIICTVFVKMDLHFILGYVSTRDFLLWKISSETNYLIEDAIWCHGRENYAVLSLWRYLVFQS